MLNDSVLVEDLLEEESKLMDAGAFVPVGRRFVGRPRA